MLAFSLACSACGGCGKTEEETKANEETTTERSNLEGHDAGKRIHIRPIPLGRINNGPPLFALDGGARPSRRHEGTEPEGEAADAAP